MRKTIAALGLCALLSACEDQSEPAKSTATTIGVAPQEYDITWDQVAARRVTEQIQFSRPGYTECTAVFGQPDWGNTEDNYPMEYSQGYNVTLDNPITIVENADEYTSGKIRSMAIEALEKANEELHFAPIPQKDAFGDAPHGFTSGYFNHCPTDLADYTCIFTRENDKFVESIKDPVKESLVRDCGYSLEIQVVDGKVLGFTAFTPWYDGGVSNY